VYLIHLPLIRVAFALAEDCKDKALASQANARLTEGQTIKLSVYVLRHTMKLAGHTLTAKSVHLALLQADRRAEQYALEELF